MENVVKNIKYFEERKKCKMLLWWMLKEMSVAIRWSLRYILQHGLVVEQWKLRRVASESQRTQSLGPQSLPLATPHLQIPSCNQKWGSAAHCSKANKEARWAEMKACFILDARNQGWGGEGQCLSKGWLPSNPTQWARAFKGRGSGLRAETIQSVLQFSSVAQSCPTLCDPMNHSTPGLPVHHQLPEFTQTHVHWVSDAIQLSHSLSSPSPPTLNLSQHQDIFKWVSSSHQVAKVLEFQLQHQSFQWTPRTDLLAVQGTLKSLLQHHSSKESTLLRCIRKLTC